MRLHRIVARLAAGLLLALPLPAVWAQAPRADCPPTAPTALPDPARQAAAATDRGLLWRLDKDGRTSWLYGTVHVNRLDWALPGPTVRQALRDVDVVALELDPSDPEIPRRMLAPVDASRRQRVLAGDAGEQLAALWQGACLPRESLLANAAPLLQVMTVALQQMRRDGFHPELAADVMLWAVARRLGKPVVALETVAVQMEAITIADEAEERDLVRQSIEELRNGDGREVLLRLLRAWEQGDAADLAAYASWCRCVDTPAEQAWMKRLNDDRNVALAARLTELHGGTTFFAGVGALHMTGPNALPRLLAARGFQVQRVSFTPQKP